jgi:ABC-type dipeptide/oligopeptide/nickel transport system permease subunit
MSSEYRKFKRKFLKNPLNVICSLIFIFFLLVAFFPSFFAPYNPLTMDPDSFMSPPSSQHWFGTDQFGRDILSRIIYGVQGSLFIASMAIVLASIAGTIIGSVSGYFGGAVDNIIMRFIDAMFAFPSIILALFIIALFGATIRNLIIAIGIIYIPIFSRTIRGSAISIKQNLYVVSARSIGKKSSKIILTDIIPNISSIFIVSFTTNFSTAILSEASLGFLGLGVPPPYPTLGRMVGDGNNFLLSAPWITLFPGLIIAVIVLSINIVGDGLRDTLDPKN